MGGACIAWASCEPSSEYPGDLCPCWNVHERSRGTFLPDPALRICDPTSAREGDSTCMDDNWHAPDESSQKLQFSQRWMEQDWQPSAKKTWGPRTDSMRLHYR